MTQSKTMTTWRRADGELVHDEYGWVSERPDEDAEYSDIPIEYVVETWERVEVCTEWVFPPAYTCEHEVCEEDAESWQQMPDGTWQQRCKDHGG
jgi:hypothetical protein